MSPTFRKFLLVMGALLIAGCITYYPWTLLDDLTGAESTLYGMTIIFWAPAAFGLGVVHGFLFAYWLWPRQLKESARDDLENKPKPRPSSMEA